jgi:hypothetical protein
MALWGVIAGFARLNIPYLEDMECFSVAPIIIYLVEIFVKQE